MNYSGADPANLFHALLLGFAGVVAVTVFYAMTVQLRGGRTGIAMILLFSGILASLSGDFGFPWEANPTLAVVCAILFVGAWVVDTINWNATRWPSESKDS